MWSRNECRWVIGNEIDQMERQCGCFCSDVELWLLGLVSLRDHPATL